MIKFFLKRMNVKFILIHEECIRPISILSANGSNIILYFFHISEVYLHSLMYKDDF